MATVLNSSIQTAIGAAVLGRLEDPDVDLTFEGPRAALQMALDALVEFAVDVLLESAEGDRELAVRIMRDLVAQAAARDAMEEAEATIAMEEAEATIAGEVGSDG